MLHENISFEMDYKSSFIDKTEREQQSYAFTDNHNLTIEIDIEIDIHELAEAIKDCLNYPNKELSWSKLDDLINQQGLSKHLTQEQSLSIIDTYYQLLISQSLHSDSALCVIKTCLKKCSLYVPPKIIDFFFRYSISHIKCYYKMSTIKESFKIIYIILPSTNEDQRQFFINYICAMYHQICLINNFPHSAFLICICTLFKFCSFDELCPYFHNLSNIIFSFLPYEQWGLEFDTIKIIKTALKRNPYIYYIIIEHKISLIPILTELVAKKKEALSRNAIDLCTLILKTNRIMLTQDKSSVERSLFNMDDINNFIEEALECIPTVFEDLEISVLQCVAESLKNDLNPLIIQKNLFDLVQNPNSMKFQHKKALLSFSSAALQIAPQLFIQPFIESKKGIMVELAFDTTDNNDEEMLLDALNIILIILDFRQSYIEGARYSEFVNYFLSFMDHDIDLICIKSIENEEVQRLASLIEERLQANET